MTCVFLDRGTLHRLHILPCHLSPVAHCRRSVSRFPEHVAFRTLFRQVLSAVLPLSWWPASKKCQVSAAPCQLPVRQSVFPGCVFVLKMFVNGYLLHVRFFYEFFYLFCFAGAYPVLGVAKVLLSKDANVLAVCRIYEAFCFFQRETIWVRYKHYFP